MATNTPSYGFKMPTDAPSAPLSDQPPPYSSVVSGVAAPYPTQQPQPPYPTSGPVGGGGYPHPEMVGSGYPHPQPEAVGGVYPNPQPGVVGGVYPHPTNTDTSSVAYTQQATAGVPVTAAVIVTATGLGSEPSNVTCPTCGQWVLTRVEYTTSWHTHITAGLLCFATMFCSMCCIGLLPYCFNAFKDAEHYCSNCNSYIGRYSKC